MSFDLIIANPPFSRKVVNNLWPTLLNCTREFISIYLTSFVDSKGKGDPQLREKCRDHIVDIYHHGHFSEDVKFDVSVYHFKRGCGKPNVFEDFSKSLKSPVERSIRDKLSKLKKIPREWIRENLNSRYAKASDRYANAVDWMNARNADGEYFLNCSCYQRNKADGIVLRENQTYAASFLGPAEYIDKFRNPLYKQLAVMLSTNKRDQQGATLAELPLEISDLELTEEEKEYLSLI